MSNSCRAWAPPTGKPPALGKEEAVGGGGTLGAAPRGPAVWACRRDLLEGMARSDGSKR